MNKEQDTGENKMKFKKLSRGCYEAPDGRTIEKQYGEWRIIDQHGYGTLGFDTLRDAKASLLFEATNPGRGAR